MLPGALDELLDPNLSALIDGTATDRLPALRSLLWRLLDARMRLRAQRAQIDQYAGVTRARCDIRVDFLATRMTPELPGVVLSDYERIPRSTIAASARRFERRLERLESDLAAVDARLTENFAVLSA